jgi:hypothetical protein
VLRTPISLGSASIGESLSKPVIERRDGGEGWAGRLLYVPIVHTYVQTRGITVDHSCRVTA